MKKTEAVHTELAEIKLSYSTIVKPSQRPKITSSHDVYQVLKSTWDEDKIELLEQFKVLMLNRANRIIGIYDVSSGGLTGTVVDPKLIFVAALKSNAAGIILAHNHPSGNLNPSEADLTLTKKIKEGGKLFDLQVLDHVIMTAEGYKSFADDGLM
jgi:DNA repair protein RadC